MFPGRRADFTSVRRFLFVLGLAATLLHAAPPVPDGEAAVRFFEKKVASDPDDFLAWNQLGTRCLTRLRETGAIAWLDRATTAATASLKAMPTERNNGGLALQCRVLLAAHRMTEAHTAAEKLRQQEHGKPLPLELLADAQIELGDTAAAAKTLAALDALPFSNALSTAPRRARLAWLQGRAEEAAKQLAATLTVAKGMEPVVPELVAWAEVQSGELHFRRGDWDAAGRAYDAALAALPGYWSAREHRAELLAARGEWDAALAELEPVVAATGRIELMQSAGDICAAAGRPADARRWHERALAAARESAARGETRDLHHLASLLCDALPEAAEAEKIARLDLEHRPNAPGALDGLAWAQHLAGQNAEARVTSDRALAGGWRDPHALHHAALIRAAAGDFLASREALRQAAAVNPRFQIFHFHR